MSRAVPPPNPDPPPPAAELSALQQSIEKAQRCDWRLRTGAELLADSEALFSLTDQLDSLRMTVIAALDASGEAAGRGHRSTGAMLKRRNPERHAPRVGRDVHLGSRLLRMPIAAAAYADGRITAEHVRVLSTCLATRFDGVFAESEEMLVQFAIDLPWNGFRRAIDRWQEAADTSEPDLRDQRDIDAREVHLSRSFNDRGILAGTLTPHACQLFGAELDRLTDQLWAQDWAAAVEELGEGNVTVDRLGRTAAQRRHDALLLMAERSRTSDGDRVEPVIYVHCSTDELERALVDVTVGGGSAPGPERVAPAPTRQSGMREYEDHTPLSLRMLAKLAVQAVIKRVVWDPAGRVIDISPGARLFSKRQREAIAVRDRVCRCGCGLSARRCEADHIVEVRDGGLTIIDNGQPKCGRSHRLKTNARNRQGRTTSR